MVAKKTKENINKTKKTIVLCAGGSGGHLFPAEALAGALAEHGFDIVLLTDKRGGAFPLGEKAVKVVRVAGAAFTGRGVLGKITSLMALSLGTVQSLAHLWRIKPAAVVGFGGFASLPGGIAAAIAGFPLFLHEQNAVLGRANRVLAKRSRAVITSFPKTSFMPRGAKVVFVGMPVREKIAKVAGTPYHKPAPSGKINLLVIGGSQGARILSEVVPAALKKLSPALKKRLVVWQQCRAENLAEVKSAYKGSGIAVELRTFFDDVPKKMAQAHLIISRAGASSMAEIFAVGRPALLVPFKLAADNHQKANALALVEAGGGWIMLEDVFTPANVAGRLAELFASPRLLSSAAECAKRKNVTKVAENLAKTIINMIKE